LDESPVTDLFWRLGLPRTTRREKTLVRKSNLPAVVGAGLRRRGEKKQISIYAEAESAQNGEQSSEAKRSEEAENENRSFGTGSPQRVPLEAGLAPFCFFYRVALPSDSTI
jgi:hypothetical protein